MTTLYIDQSLNSTGILLYDGTYNFKLLVPECSPKWLRELPFVWKVIAPNFCGINTNNLGSLNKAIGQITTIERIINDFNVDTIVVESLAYGCVSKTKDILSYLFNRIVELSYRYGISLYSYSPIETGKVCGWKVGSGSEARKQATINVFRDKFGASYDAAKNKLDNLADAYALMLTHNIALNKP